MKKTMCVLLSVILSAGIFSSCGLSQNAASENRFDGGVFEKETIRILSGSENKELSDILSQCSKKTGVTDDYSKYGNIFNAEWGIDTGKILSPITMPSGETLMKALNLYQTVFRKP